MLRQECMTTDGPWHGLTCVNCGLVADTTMLTHRANRPEPYKTVPLTKVKRLRVRPG